MRINLVFEREFNSLEGDFGLYPRACRRIRRRSDKHEKIRISWGLWANRYQRSDGLCPDRRTSWRPFGLVGRSLGHGRPHLACVSRGQTEKICLGTGIKQISARVPSMTAMTALSLNDISDGRFTLGLGVSGPQVVEGPAWRFLQSPAERLRETVEILRMAFRGEKLALRAIPYVPRQGGEGKAIRLNHRPAEIPIFLATLAPKSLEFTGAAADGWLWTSFSPDYADAHLAT
ncbi:MAG: hypothetical protein CM15mP75_0030 [Flammeovirgaceae bacterium]|nr:MAG: hypothetical protein CM15mP75_0030 [Flammeovirgaceae bacterium]